MADNLLSVRGLTKKFGGLIALEDISIQFHQGKIHAIIGPNGSGKTTLLNILSGVYQPSSGEVIFCGEKIQGLPPYAITEKGMGRTFQNIRLFESLTVIENVMIGSEIRLQCSLLGTIIPKHSNLSEERKVEEFALQWLDFVGLGSKHKFKASGLSYGQRRLVEIARALATKPKLLLLDEPAAGMNISEIKELISMIKRIQILGINVILVEHNMRFVMGISDVVTVLDFGRKIAEGPPEQITMDKKVLEAYLGKSVANATS